MSKNHLIRARDELCDTHTLKHTFTYLNIQQSSHLFSPADVKELICPFIDLVSVSVKATKPNVNNIHFIFKINFIQKGFIFILLSFVTLKCPQICTNPEINFQCFAIIVCTLVGCSLQGELR